MKRQTKLASLSVSLPKDQRTWVEQRVATAGYGNVSDYVRELIRRDQKTEAQDRLERLLIDALKSGKRIEVTPEYWERKRADLIARYGKRRKKAQ